MSDEPTRRLEISVRRAKVIQEEAKRSLEELYRKNAEMFSNREITYQDSTKINTKVIAPSQAILEESDLTTQLNNIIRFSNVRLSAPLFAIDETLRIGEWIDLLRVLKDLGFSLNTLFEKPLPSVDIARTRSGEQPISKAVDNLLFTYTPFKLRGARREDYIMLLLPSTRGSSITRTWFSNEANYFFEDGIKVITPDEVRPIPISEIHDLIFVNGEQFFRLEIDRRIANGAYYCRMGHYISPLRSCNRRNCWLWSICQGNRFWSRTPRSFYSIAKVSPNIKVKVDSYDEPQKIVEIENILTFEKIDELLAKIYIASVTFMSRYMIRNPLIRLRETIGYRVNTRAIALALDAAWLKNFIRELLNRDEVLYRWIYTKHFILENFDVNDVRQISRFFWNLIESRRTSRIRRFIRGFQSREVTEDLVAFGCKLLLHTLSHVMHEEVIAYLQTSSSNIIYAYNEKPERDGKYRIFLFENAERGLGLTESFTSRIEKRREKMIIDMINDITERIGVCNMAITSSINLEDASEDVRTILAHLDRYNRVLSITYGISIPVEIARYVLAREDRETARIIDSEEVSAYMDDILSIVPLCWDGCYQCVRLETDCHEPPYEQMFLVSKHLLVAFLNEWRGTFAKTSCPVTTLKQPLLEIGEARNLFNYIKSAQRDVKLISPWISEQVARMLCDMASKRRVKFEILTSLDISVETHKKAIQVFLDANISNIEVRVLRNKQLHAKMVTVDENTIIIGSANLTLSGLYENIECYVVLASPEILRNALNKFRELWDQAVPLQEAV